MTKHLMCSALAALLGVGLTTTFTEANSLADPGFEDPGLYTADGPPFVGSWEAFTGSANAFSAHATTDPRTDTGHASISILGDDNSFAGVFQDVVVTPGLLVEASVWQKTPDSGLLGVAPEFRIEWRDAAGLELSRVTNDGVIPTNDYTLLEVSGVAPAGAAFARFTFAVQTFGGEPDGGASNSGTIFLDDASVRIPEPTAAVLALLALAPLARRR